MLVALNNHPEPTLDFYMEFLSMHKHVILNLFNEDPKKINIVYEVDDENDTECDP